MKSSKASKISGSVVIGSLIISSIMLVIFVAIGSGVTYQIREDSRVRRSIQGIYIAEGGLERAMNMLKQNPYWKDGYANQNIGSGSYGVQVVDLGNDFLRLEATATVESRSVKIFSRLKPIYKKLSSMRFGAFGGNSVSLGNGKLYSYDSSLNATPDPNNPGDDGDVGTNSKAASSLTISANSQVYGDLITGAGSDPNTVISAHPDALITGSRSAAASDYSLSKVKVPSNAIPMGSLNSSITLSEGSYHFTSISLAGSDYLKTTGPVKLYVSGSISIGGNGEKRAASYKPQDLRIYATNSVSSVSISGNATFYGVIYAPNADITLNGGGSHGIVAGSVAGKNVTFNGDSTNLYYDVALKGLSESEESGEVSKYQTSAFWRG